MIITVFYYSWVRIDSDEPWPCLYWNLDMTKHKDRKEDILDTAELLFYKKGYDKTTVNDILESLSISKGAFYHYFKSKEEVMDSIVMRTIQKGMDQAQAVLHNDRLSVHEKFLGIILAQQPNENNDKMQLIEQLHLVNNAQLHQKSIIETITHLTPLLQTVVKQGIDEGFFKTPYSGESIEFILAATSFLFDSGFFQHLDKEQLNHKVKATIYLVEACLGAEEGSMANLVAAFGNVYMESKNELPN